MKQWQIQYSITDLYSFHLSCLFWKMSSFLFIRSSLQDFLFRRQNHVISCCQQSGPYHRINTQAIIKLKWTETPGELGKKRKYSTHLTLTNQPQRNYLPHILKATFQPLWQSCLATTLSSVQQLIFVQKIDRCHIEEKTCKSLIWNLVVKQHPEFWQYLKIIFCFFFSAHEPHISDIWHDVGSTNGVW